MLAAGLTACGTAKQLSAGEKLSGAFEKLGDAKSLSFQLSADATAEQIVAFGKAVGDPIEQKDAELLSDLTLSVSMSADKPLKDTEAFKAYRADQLNDTYDLKGVAIGYSLSGKKSGKTLADIRLVGDKMYVQADVKGIAALSGEDTKEMDQFVSALPAEAGPIKDVFAGKWISLDLKKLNELGKKQQGSGQAGANPLNPMFGGGVPDLDPAELQRFGKTVKSVLSKNVTVEEKGKSGDADVIQVSAPARPLVEGLLKAVEKLAAGTTGFPPVPSEDMPKVPDRKFSADVLIKNGKAQAVTFDLMQFADKPDASAHFPLRLGFAADAPAVAAPTGATEIDLAQLEKTFSELASADGMGGSDSSDGPGTPATPLTEEQYTKLAAAGIDRAQAKSMNEAGLSFDEIIELKDIIKG
ncbi:hypothetical protein [Kitasatospora sp. CB01950]|uniref:hypothetical protein n=1 Tax=Kitasatospora sp. CB01950 TaxID=1703930 RepID=UPI000939B0D3|nr:hypothetical protein [Kitasatospora sp. CB01950]OKJ11702.1 hypothetical protein AMK19_12610 [Kitasatospora sp. CB01950]